ncbi:MAG: hypothetical protein NZ739_02235 [Verrucomicrobiae bacterium]|nr:hypothetical protein [Verrucomicrobiae bacterium]
MAGHFGIFDHVAGAQVIAWTVAGLILGRLGVALWLAWLNRRHVQLHAAEVPEPYRGVIDGATYAKAIRYALAKNRFGQVAEVYSALVLISVSFSGVLPGAYSVLQLDWALLPGRPAHSWLAWPLACNWPSCLSTGMQSSGSSSDSGSTPRHCASGLLTNSKKA